MIYLHRTFLRVVSSRYLLCHQAQTFLKFLAYFVIRTRSSRFWRIFCLFFLFSTNGENIMFQVIQHMEYLKTETMLHRIIIHVVCERPGCGYSAVDASIRSVGVPALLPTKQLLQSKSYHKNNVPGVCGRLFSPSYWNGEL